jgi:Cu+-exporting ATPase
MKKRRKRTMAKDPVCGMNVDEQNAAGKTEYRGNTYYFCSPGFKKSLDKEPEKYIRGSVESEQENINVLFLLEPLIVEHMMTKQDDAIQPLKILDAL